MSEQPTVTAEGATLGEALAVAAAELGVAPAQVLHKLDADHFRNQYGAMTGANTVKIFAWVRDPAEFAAGQSARDYIAELVEKMGFQASVRFRIRPGNNADVRIDSESARFLVGKQGRTLNAIRQLLAENVGRNFPDWSYHLDVVGGERDRADAGDRGGRGRDRGRDRDRGRGRDRGDRGGRNRERSESDVEALKRLGYKVAQRVSETGETEVIRKRLNSFERRVIHLAVKEMDGVGSRSVKHEDEKRIEVYALAGDQAGEE